jgi:hypothetical protein
MILSVLPSEGDRRARPGKRRQRNMENSRTRNYYGNLAFEWGRSCQSQSRSQKTVETLSDALKRRHSPSPVLIKKPLSTSLRDRRDESREYQ